MTAKIIDIWPYMEQRNNRRSEARRKQRLTFNLHEIPTLQSFKEPIKWVLPSEPFHGPIEPVSTNPIPVIRVNYTKEDNDPEH